MGKVKRLNCVDKSLAKAVVSGFPLDIAIGVTPVNQIFVKAFDGMPDVAVGQLEIAGTGYQRPFIPRPQGTTRAMLVALDASEITAVESRGVLADLAEIYVRAGDGVKDVFSLNTPRYIGSINDHDVAVG